MRPRMTNPMMQSVAAIARRKANAGGGILDFRTGLAAEWDADAISGSDGDPVSSWPETIASNDATQAFGGFQPTLQTSEVNGHNAVSFDGTGDQLESTYAATLGDFTAFAVVNFSAFGVNFPRVVDKSFNSGFWIGYSNSGTPGIGGGCLQTSAPFMSQTGATSTATWYVISVRRSGTSWTVRVNGSANAASATVSSTALSSDVVRLGASNSAGDEFSGMLAQVRIYSDDLSDADRLNVEQFLGSVYGITITP